MEFNKPVQRFTKIEDEPFNLDRNSLEFSGFIDSHLDQNKINRKILDLNEIKFDDIPKNLFFQTKIKSRQINTQRYLKACFGILDKAMHL